MNLIKFETTFFPVAFLTEIAIKDFFLYIIQKDRILSK